MAIEPLASVMSVQAQTTLSGRKVQNDSTNTENETMVVQEIEKADKTINVVDESKNKGGAANNETAAKDQQWAKDQQLTKEQQQTKEQSDSEKLRKAVEKLNKSMVNSEAVFGFHEETNRVMIKIIDRESKEVIKEIPPEKTLDMIAKVWELAGILVDEKR